MFAIDLSDLRETDEPNDVVQKSSYYIIAVLAFCRGAYENAFFYGFGEITRLRADEWLYGDHYAESPSVNDVDRLFHRWKPLLIQRKITHFCLPKFVEQHVT